MISAFEDAINGDETEYPNIDLAIDQLQAAPFTSSKELEDFLDAKNFNDRWNIWKSNYMRSMPGTAPKKISSCKFIDLIPDYKIRVKRVHGRGITTTNKRTRATLQRRRSNLLSPFKTMIQHAIAHNVVILRNCVAVGGLMQQLDTETEVMLRIYVDLGYVLGYLFVVLLD